MEVQKLSTVGKIIGGGTPDSKNKDYWNGNILWAVPTDITKLCTKQIENTGRKITQQGLDNSSAKLLPVGTVLITSRATIGACAITSKSISTNQGFQNIICNNDYDASFIYYFIKQNPNNLMILSQGTTFLEISNNHMKKSLILKPNSLMEQQKISTILSNIDNLLTTTQKIIEQTKLLKKGLLQKLLTNGINHDNFKSVEWIYQKKIRIPKIWRTMDFRKLILTSKNGFTGKPNEDGNGMPRLGISSISESDTLYVKKNIHKFIQIEKSKVDSYLVQINDLLVCRQNGNLDLIGKTKIIQEIENPMIFSDSLISLKINPDEILIEFITLFLEQEIGRKQILRYITTTAGNYSINGTNLKKIKILCPPIPEQEQIVSIISNIDTQIQKEKIHKSNLERLKKGLMQKLLTGQIRVQV